MLLLKYLLAKVANHMRSFLYCGWWLHVNVYDILSSRPPDQLLFSGR